MKLVIGKKRRKESARFPMKDAAKLERMVRKYKERSGKGELESEGRSQRQGKRRGNEMIEENGEKEGGSEKNICKGVCVSRVYVDMYRCVWVYVQLLDEVNQHCKKTVNKVLLRAVRPQKKIICIYKKYC